MVMIISLYIDPLFIGIFPPSVDLWFTGATIGYIFAASIQSLN